MSDARRARVPMLNFDRSVSKPRARAKSPLPSAIIRMRSPTPFALAQAVTTWTSFTARQAIVATPLALSASCCVR